MLFVAFGILTPCASSLFCFHGVCISLIRAPPPRTQWQATFFFFGIPFLVPAVTTSRVLLAWSAKVLMHFDVCASLVLSLVTNTGLSCLLVLALDSRKLSSKVPAFQILIATESMLFVCMLWSVLRRCGAGAPPRVCCVCVVPCRAV